MIKLNVMLIDGDKAAFSILERMLVPYEFLHLVGSYSDPYQALATLNRYPLDMIFLDLDIQYINCLEIAARIGRLCETTEIVFVTVEPHYAIEAFNLNVMDYLLKPIEQPRLDQTIMKLLRRVEKRNFIRTVVK
ncbi:response regulator [Paenibacillus psychroresistens]|uniref:Response regulator n=1 Tax=Paenibacillus psychroresistens TaxID=1778678 RepID=A0A6B8RT24_9BACL|nr:response regulator [Paenibacillus psychroresistens]QGQ99610.1 response regulator [Paenibacillus psychroresistens]